jgi:hypothetical protein
MDANTCPDPCRIENEPLRSDEAAYFGGLCDPLRGGGFVVIPVLGKKPFIPGWEKFWTSPPRDASYAKWRKASATQNVGLCMGEVIGIDIDHDVETTAEEAQAIAFEVLGPTPFVRVGRAPRRTLFYRVNYEDAHHLGGWRVGKVQLLAKGNQSVIYGTHPDTVQPYVWTVRELSGARLQDLPLVDFDKVANLKKALSGLQEVLGAGPVVAAQNGSGAKPSGDDQPLRGDRNKRLFDHLREIANRCPDFETLNQHALDWNVSLPEPLPPSEVYATAKQVWSYKENGCLWGVGTKAPVVLPLSREQLTEVMPLLKPSAAKLFLLLAATRG